MRFIKTLIALGLAALGSAAMAQTATTTFNVTATVAKNCLVSATNLAFGAYDPASTTALDGSSTISVRCTRTTPFTVALSAGGTGGTFASRVMRETTTPANQLTYNLFTTPTRDVIWGDGSVGSSTATLPGTGAGMGVPQAQSLTVHGRIPVQPTAAPGSYSDTVTVTVSY